MLFFKNEAYYNEILDKLKVHGFDASSNYKDIICFLYDQYQHAAKILHEYEFYMKQMKINSSNPISAIKVRTLRISSFIFLKRY